MLNRARTISFGIVDGQAVFMDERSDSYFQVDGLDPLQLYRSLDRGEALANAPLREALGLTDEPTQILRADCAQPSRSLLEESSFSWPAVGDLVRVAGLLRGTKRRLGSKPIESLLLDLALVEQNPAPTGAGEALSQLTRRFLAARRLIPARSNCLVDSLALLRWLDSERGPAQIIFGVKLDPFAAHCWVQAGDQLLNDRRDTIAGFVPVRAIRCSDVTP